MQFEPFLRALASAAKLDTLDGSRSSSAGASSRCRAMCSPGRCPYGADTTGAEPVRERHAAVQAMLVGFYSALPPGELTRRGSRLHVHALIEDAAGAAARVVHAVHVDSVRIPKDAMLQVPRPPQATEPAAPAPGS